jgi:Bacterial Ig-like domain (group 3)/FG-GAP-like repeat/Domain of unknown function DUF11
MRISWPLGLGLLALLAVGIQSPAVASVTSTSGNVIYVDTSSNVQPNLLGNYVSYNVTNDTGSPIADAWVTIGSFTGSYVSLAPNETGVTHLGTMAAGATRTVFFYLNVDCSSFSAGQCNVSTLQPFTVRLYSGRPTANLLSSQSFSVTVQETIAAQANKVTTVVTSSNSPTLGALITVTVTGNTGQIGSGKLFYASPETYFDFPANSFRLYSTSVTFSGGNTGTYTDQLLVPSSAFTSTSATDYTFVATYLVVGPTSALTAVSPVAFISSGNATKHTGTSSYASFPPIGTTSNSLTVTKLLNSATWPTGGVPTYTVRVTNSASSSVTLDDLVDSLPSSPANVTYVPGSATFAGSPIADPSISGSTLTWTGLFAVPASGSADLTFQATVPSVGGTYTNSAIGHIGSTQIDATLSTSDDSPATVSLNVGTPDLIITKTHSGNFVQGQTGASFSIMVSNGGTGITSGTVAVTDTLPAGLMATGMSGPGWNCTLGSLSCTRSDALGASGSYPAITLTVNVGSNAAASVTNTATVSGGGESNTANDTASDVTTVGTQTPTATATTLTLLPGTSVSAGTTISLTATVLHGSTPVFPGLVTFCDAAASQCTGAAIFATAQLTNSGSATANLVLGSGTYSIKAVFAGTTGFQSSESLAQALIVTGTAGYASTTTIALSGSSNSYSLTGTVAAFGKPVPTGTVSFLDTTTGNSVLGTATLDPASLGFTLAPATASPAVNGSPHFATGDFNHDGKIDLAVPNGSGSTVSVLLGNGDGTFQAPLIYNTDTNGSAYALAVGDFNADGNPDLVVTNIGTGSATISVLLGNGDGTFQLQVPYVVGNHPSEVVVGDFNGDGDADVAVANRDDNTLSVLLGNGDGTFQTQVTYAVGNSPAALVAADLNGDGNVDLVVANGSDNTLSVLLGNGDGTFQAQATYAVGNSPAALVAADLNGDGNVDLVAANGSDNTLSVLLGNGDGTFQAQATYAVGNSPAALVTADLNGDGNPDLVATNEGDNTVSVLLGKGDGTLQPATAFSVGAGAAGLATGDFNGDGLADVASVGNTVPSSATVLLSEHTINATATGVSLSTPGTHEVLASYPGDSDHGASQSAPIAVAGPALTATTTVLSASPNPASAGQSVTFTATVSPTPTGTSTGTVSFYDGATLLGTVTLNSAGVATLSTSSLMSGANSITAAYSGNATFAGSTSSVLTETVAGSGVTSTTTLLAASPNPAVVGQQVTFTATVSPAPTGTPTGTVSFYNGATLLGTGTVNSAGIATFATSGLTAGTASITAVYSGNAGFATSTSATLNLAVGSASVYTVTAPQTPFTVMAGDSVDVNVSVQPVGGGYNNVVTMSAAGLPPGAAAVFNPPTVTPGTAGAPTVMTIRTSTQAAGTPANHNPQFPFAPTVLAAGAIVVARNRKRLGRSFAVLLLMVSVAAGAWMLTGCNGGFAGRPAPQSRSYVITITGTSGSLHPSATITLTVR